MNSDAHVSTFLKTGKTFKAILDYKVIHKVPRYKVQFIGETPGKSLYYPVAQLQMNNLQPQIDAYNLKKKKITLFKDLF